MSTTVNQPIVLALPARGSIHVRGNDLHIESDKVQACETDCVDVRGTREHSGVALPMGPQLHAALTRALQALQPQKTRDLCGTEGEPSRAAKHDKAAVSTCGATASLCGPGAAALPVYEVCLIVVRPVGGGAHREDTNVAAAKPQMPDDPQVLLADKHPSLGSHNIERMVAYHDHMCQLSTVSQSPTRFTLQHVLDWARAADNGSTDHTTERICDAAPPIYGQLVSEEDMQTMLRVYLKTPPRHDTESW